MLNFYKKFSDTTLSIILMIISGFSFIVMHSAAKFLSDQIHIFEITFLRCALVIVVLAPMIFKEGRSAFITKQPKFQIYRIITNSGKDGGQEVPHFHIHILGGEKIGPKIR